MTTNSAHADSVIVVGGGTLGVAVVERLLGHHDTVLFLDPDRDAVEAAAAHGATAKVVDVTSGRALEAAVSEKDAFELAIVVAERDATALLVGQLVKTKLDVATVIVLMDEPHNRVAFETAGLTPICASTALADAVAATHSLILLRGSGLPPGLLTPPNKRNSSLPRGPV